MTEKPIIALALAASAGAIATMTGVYFSKIVKKRSMRKKKMKLHNNHLFLSTRCTWLIAGTIFLVNCSCTRKALCKYLIIFIILVFIIII